MPHNKIILGATAAGFLLSSFALQAADPVSNIGITGSHNKYKISSDIDSLDNNKQRMPKVGVYYNYGNKITGAEGLIYQAGVEAKYGKKSDVKDQQGQAEADIGYRLDIGNRNYIDGIVGAGYKHSKVDDTKGVDVRLTTKSPFAKAGLGFSHKGDTVLSRLEVGTRYNINAESKIKVQHLSSTTVDLKDKYSPYAQLDFMWDKGYNDMPLTAGVYYTKTNYQLKDKRYVDNTKLKNDEFGVKVGLAF
ncbi:MAG TPA: outer membrane beta-barrel protein [Pseudomonadales bacterium]|nr:outer membrane beta-barrel protein [Pseudomonadales bacterium]